MGNGSRCFEAPPFKNGGRSRGFAIFAPSQFCGKRNNKRKYYRLESAQTHLSVCKALQMEVCGNIVFDHYSRISFSSSRQTYSAHARQRRSFKRLSRVVADDYCVVGIAVVAVWFSIRSHLFFGMDRAARNSRHSRETLYSSAPISAFVFRPNSHWALGHVHGLGRGNFSRRVQRRLGGDGRRFIASRIHSDFYVCGKLEVSPHQSLHSSADDRRHLYFQRKSKSLVQRRAQRRGQSQHVCARTYHGHGHCANFRKRKNRA